MHVVHVAIRGRCQAVQMVVKGPGRLGVCDHHSQHHSQPRHNLRRRVALVGLRLGQRDARARGDLTPGGAGVTGRGPIRDLAAGLGRVGHQHGNLTPIISSSIRGRGSELRNLSRARILQAHGGRTDGADRQHFAWGLRGQVGVVDLLDAARTLRVCAHMEHAGCGGDRALHVALGRAHDRHLAGLVALQRAEPARVAGVLGARGAGGEQHHAWEWRQRDGRGGEESACAERDRSLAAWNCNVVHRGGASGCSRQARDRGHNMHKAGGVGRCGSAPHGHEMRGEGKREQHEGMRRARSHGQNARLRK
eukprot:m.75106 g.75106  ORF g.75106 m.75106 type:complete len:307 (-) comp7799_c0_seq1:32-952(-)